MSFLARLSARALPALSRAPAVMPKGFAARQMAPVYREAAPPEEEPEIAAWRAPAARTLRRAEAPPEENTDVSRAPEVEAQDDESEIQPARLRRVAGQTPAAEEEEPVAPLRRANAEENEQDVAPLRRAEAPDTAEDEPVAQPMRIIRRAEEVPLDGAEKPLRQPFQADLVPGAVPAHPDLANEDASSDLQALRRDVAPPRAAVSTPPNSAPPALGPADMWMPGPVADRSGGETGFAADLPVFAPGGFATEPASPRAQVVIDQLDVLIHEPAAPAAPSRAQADHGRLMRARYLRRL